MKKVDKKGLITKATDLVKHMYQFATQDIWRITGKEMNRTHRFFYDAARSMILAYRGFSQDKLMVKASALTYYTLFAIVPILALILAIGRGFGMQEQIVGSLSDQLSGASQAMVYILSFVDKYLAHAKGGVFIGVGVVMLLWSVISGFSHVETIFNDVWQVKKGRSFSMQLSTYFSMMMVVPVFLIATSGMSIFLSSFFGNTYLGILGPVVGFFLRLVPYVIDWLLFTLLFIIIPNTKVKFVPALIAGVFTGTFFQLFQYGYIKGQVFLSSYNAVYGGFAVIPLLLLWLQITWLIILLGAELSFAVQNIRNYEFEADMNNISLRYMRFITLVVMTLIVKQFDKGEKPMNSEDLSQENKIPIRLCKNVLNRLVEAKLIYAMQNEKTLQKTYVPAIDINKLTVSCLFDKLDKDGAETFHVDKKFKFLNLWILNERMNVRLKESDDNLLLKDIAINEKNKEQIDTRS